MRPVLSEPPLISGCSILELVDDHNVQSNAGTLFHGTPLELREIEPRWCRQWRSGMWLPDTHEPVVCASDDPAIAAFRAIVPRTQQIFGCARERNSAGGLTFLVPETYKDKFLSSVGYVALCDAADFNFYNPYPAAKADIVCEYRSAAPITPLCNVEIDYTDFEDLLYASPGNRLEYT